MLCSLRPASAVRCRVYLLSCYEALLIYCAVSTSSENFFCMMTFLTCTYDPLRTKTVLDNNSIEHVSHFSPGCDFTYGVNYDVDLKSWPSFSQYVTQFVKLYRGKNKETRLHFHKAIPFPVVWLSLIHI